MQKILNAQFFINTHQTSNVGFSVGANLAFGTHIQRFGFNLNLFVTENQFQSNTEMRLYYNLKNLGPSLSYTEFVLSQGVLFSWGTKKDFLNPFIGLVSNQTWHFNSLAYAYNAYFNKKKTTQQTGLIAINFNNTTLISENDLLARPTLDRFRTAAFLIQYQYQNQFQIGLNCTLWTGQYRHKKLTDNSKFRRGCYLDTLHGTYTNYSHGLLSLQFKYQPMYYQTFQANAGLDAEQIRNLIQNKFIHDMPFIPKKWNKSNNCHIPMLDEKGNPYLYLENQKIKKPKMYFNLFSNASYFY